MWSGILAKSGLRHQSGAGSTLPRNAPGTRERTRTGVGVVQTAGTLRLQHAGRSGAQACVPAMMPVIVVMFTISCTDEK